MSRTTLLKHFREELDNGATKANVKVVAALFKMATSGDCPAATIFWCKTRLGWREKDDRLKDEAIVVRRIEWLKSDSKPESS